MTKPNNPWTDPLPDIPQQPTSLTPYQQVIIQHLIELYARAVRARAHRLEGEVDREPT